MNEQHEELLRDFERLKKNRKNVPLEVLQTKYKKGYDALKHKLVGELKKYVNELTLLGIYDLGPDVTSEVWKEWENQIQDIMNQGAATGLSRQLGHAVFGNLDLKEFEELVIGRITLRVKYEVYAPYWLRHCKENAAGEIENDLIGMKWDSEAKVWVGKGTNGCPCFTIKLPATPELMQEAKEEETALFCRFRKLTKEERQKEISLKCVEAFKKAQRMEMKSNGNEEEPAAAATADNR